MHHRLATLEPSFPPSPSLPSSSAISEKVTESCVPPHTFRSVCPTDRALLSPLSRSGRPGGCFCWPMLLPHLTQSRLCKHRPALGALPAGLAGAQQPSLGAEGPRSSSSIREVWGVNSQRGELCTDGQRGSPPSRICPRALLFLQSLGDTPETATHPSPPGAPGPEVGHALRPPRHS